MKGLCRKWFVVPGMTLFLVFSLALVGCGGNTNSDTAGNTDVSSSSGATEDPEATESSSGGEAAGDSSAAPYVVADDDICTLTAMPFMDHAGNPGYQLEFVNNQSDQDIMVRVLSDDVFTIDGTTVAAHSSSETVIPGSTGGGQVIFTLESGGRLGMTIDDLINVKGVIHVFGAVDSTTGERALLATYDFVA